MSQSKRSRRNYTPEQKAEILKEHLVDKKPVSEVCTKHNLQPSVFYDKTEIAVDRFIPWLGIARGKFFEWRKRDGKANEHNALIPAITGCSTRRSVRSPNFTSGSHSRAIGGSRS